ncbi:T9SS type A sorting domain-containing protein [Aequorivita marina]|uniref:T9SS type A sorting domain-containing protein n=1 Tax=Aequorivita marina TaxID=3073654 RepID=UPI002876AA95|nr:T9SS type A sorting domain-containing protein [Aequorivita sp. S2608]MDS1298145.1 T9SS type A sorting domain-containing protein [Aequorivita sp. S2608]
MILCTLFVITGFAQSEESGSSLTIPDRTPELEALYQQAKALENNGTAAQINANRIAIKNAWQEVNPEIANLYKPINAPGNGPQIIEVEISAQDSEPIERSPEDWDTDLLLREGFIDGLDMDATLDGDIYIAAYENYIGDNSALYIYRSTDHGNTFALWKELNVNNSYFAKIQVISIDGEGDDYLSVFSMFENGVFQVLRWNMATGEYDFQSITTSDVTDFSVDRNYPIDTDAQRVFAIYTRDNSGSPKIYSARSTAGSYGFGWVDETALPGANLGEIAFAYGQGGACYTTYLGLGSGNLYARPNLDYNDPGSWGGIAETVEEGTLKEIKNPIIRATRNLAANDNVLIVASGRDAGSSDQFTGRAYKRENEDPFVSIGYVSTTPDYNIVQFDSWISREANGLERIQTSYVRERKDGSADNVNRVRTYNGSDFDPFEPVSDNGIDVFQGFSSAVAETSDGLPCLAFAGTSTAVNNGYNLYFDSKSTLSVEENNLEGFTFYPNPTRDNLNLSAKNTIEKVGIYSLLGQEVMQLFPEKERQSIDVSSLASGVYVMKVEVNDEIGTYKIIKK